MSKYPILRGGSVPCVLAKITVPELAVVAAMYGSISSSGKDGATTCRRASRSFEKQLSHRLRTVLILPVEDDLFYTVQQLET